MNWSGSQVAHERVRRDSKGWPAALEQLATLTDLVSDVLANGPAGIALGCGLGDEATARGGTVHRDGVPGALSDALCRRLGRVSLRGLSRHKTARFCTAVHGSQEGSFPLELRYRPVIGRAMGIRRVTVVVVTVRVTFTGPRRIVRVVLRTAISSSSLRGNA